VRYHGAMRSVERRTGSCERIPSELLQLPQWVNWRNEDGRKVPVNPRSGRNAGVNWPDTWSAFGQAKRVAQEHNLGLGFVITETDPYTCVDLDACIDKHGQIDAQTRQVLDLLSGWVELSPSGIGLHVWVRNEKPVSRRIKGLEIYSYSRWMSITGRSNPNGPTEIADRTDEIEELLHHFMRDPVPSSPLPKLTPMDDLEIWSQLFHNENGDYYAALYYGDLSRCRGDHALAVIQLANQLAWMTDFDANRMKGLLYETKLVREKWEERRGDITWIDYQIRDAIAYMSSRQ
jgi:putative DNA primase/helicase